MKEQSPLIQRIKKLLSLATSQNDFEAKAAADKANELLVKHNLSMQELSDVEKDYTANSVVRAKYKLSVEEELVGGLMQNFFVIALRNVVKWDLVNGIFPRATVRLTLIGERGNVAIAKFAFEFLLKHGKKEFLARKKAKLLKEKDRKSFFTGYVLGLDQQFKSTRKKVETGAGLVVVVDPGIEKWARAEFGKFGSSPPGASFGNGHDIGFEVGKETRLQRAVPSERTDSGKFLTK